MKSTLWLIRIQMRLCMVWCVYALCAVLGTRGDSIIYIQHIVYYTYVYIYAHVSLIDKWRLVAIYSYRKISLALDSSVILKRYANSLSLFGSLFHSVSTQTNARRLADLIVYGSAWLRLKCYRTANLSMLDFWYSLSRTHAPHFTASFFRFALFRFAMPHQVMPCAFACFVCVRLPIIVDCRRFQRSFIERALLSMWFENVAATNNCRNVAHTGASQCYGV